MKTGLLGRLATALALAFATIAPVQARDGTLETQFDSAFGTQVRAPREFTPSYNTALERQLAELASGAHGRIGVAAIDLVTGQEVAILGDQRFPMASTSKVAIAATFMDGVERGRWTLDTRFPLRQPIPSKPLSSAIAPTRAGSYLPARDLIELMITRSSNQATDALLAAVGGPAAVNDWTRRAGVMDFNLTRDIATLVRDDGEIDPAVRIDIRDSATPRAMVQLVGGIYQGKWLTQASRATIVGAMERCRTGKSRIKGGMPDEVMVAHKTGTLSNTASDIGVVTGPDGHSIAVAIYVTGQGGKASRDAKIATLARAIYDGYLSPPTSRQYASASYAVAQQ
ncbi:MAG: serine hydrolase [Croceibacterium sp.]